MRDDGSDLLDSRLASLAEAIADGRRIDWDAVESSALDAHERALIARLRTVGQIAQLHDPAGGHGASNPAPASATPPLLERQTSWGALRVLSHLGSGRFGDVYRAFDPALDREVALKLLRDVEPPPATAAGDAAEPAVVHEGRLMARLRHPNIVTIYGAQRIDGRTGISMELVEGQTLAAELKARGPFAPGDVMTVGIELCRALAAVHAAGLVHRDVKAQNVLRESATGRIVLGDFGTGRELDDLERGPAIAGTPACLAPEIFARGAATPQSDLYSLGALLFHLSTGEYPVPGRSVAELRDAHARGRRRVLGVVRRDFPSSLAHVIEIALAPHASGRYGSAAAMERALVKAQRAGVVLPRAAALLGILLLSILSAGLVTRWMGSEAGPGSTTGRPASTATADSAPVARSMSPDEASLAAAPAEAVAPVVAEPRADATERGPVPFRGVAELTLTRINPAFSERIRIYNGSNPRFVTCTVRGRQAIALCDLEAGEIRELRAPSLPGERGELPRLSPDGSRIAYVWYSFGNAGVRLMGADGSADREVLPPESGSEVMGIKWMWAQDAVLIRRDAATPQGRRVRYLVVPLDGRPVSSIPAFEEIPPGEMDISPDGRHLVLQRQSADGDNDLAVLDAQTGEERLIASGPTEERSPLWTPDGRALLYRSDAGGMRRLYILSMEDGRPRGAPRHLQDFPRGMVTPIGFTADGTLLIERLTHWYNTFRATANLPGGAIGTPRPLDLRAATEETPGVSVSRTGLVAYVGGTLGARGLPARVLVLQPDGRVDRELRLLGHATRKTRVRWSPDGSRIAVSSQLSDRTVIELFHAARAEREGLIEAGGAWDHHWDPFANAIYYAAGNEIRRHDLETGDVRSVYRSAMPLATTATFDVSPVDGSLLLPGQLAILIVPPDGRTIVRRPIRDLPAAVAWTPDGSRILLSTIGPNHRSRASVVVMDAQSGDPVTLDVDAEPLTDLAFSPDERELFFAAGNQFPGYWILGGLSAP